MKMFSSFLEMLLGDRLDGAAQCSRRSCREPETRGDLYGSFRLIWVIFIDLGDTINSTVRGTQLPTSQIFPMKPFIVHVLIFNRLHIINICTSVIREIMEKL
jgi:hypothetical protein